MSNTKDLKDYITFYSGLKCIVHWKEAESHFEEFINRIDMRRGGHLKTDLYMSEGKKRDTFKVEDIKPLLRPVQDMKEEEAVHIARLAMQSFLTISWFQYLVQIGAPPKKEPKFSFKVYIYDKEKDGSKDYYKIEMQIEGTPLYVSIWDDFNITVTDDDEHEVSNQAKIFHFMVKKGFDVFGLIADGLAYDKTLRGL